MQQRLHDRGMAGIADGAVVQRADLALQRFAERAETARGVEGFVGDAVEREFLALFKGRDLDAAAPSTMASQGSIYSLMTPSVLQVRL